MTLIQASSKCASPSLSPYSEDLRIAAPREKVLACLWVSQLSRLFIVQGLIVRSWVKWEISAKEQWGAAGAQGEEQGCRGKAQGSLHLVEMMSQADRTAWHGEEAWWKIACFFFFLNHHVYILIIVKQSKTSSSGKLEVLRPSYCFLLLFFKYFLLFCYCAVLSHQLERRSILALTCAGLFLSLSSSLWMDADMHCSKLGSVYSITLFTSMLTPPGISSGPLSILQWFLLLVLGCRSFGC